MATKLTWDKAILKVLNDAGGPMDYNEIATQIIEQDLVKTSTATPANSVNSYLHSDKLTDKVVPIRRGVYILKDLLQKDPSLATLPVSENTEEDEESNVDDALITAYGRFWSRSQWEDNNNRLYGTSVRTANAAGVDFADYAGIYLLHKGYEVIYVGQAKRLVERLDAHTKDDKRNRWDNFSWFCIDDIDEAIEKESSKIQKSLSIPALLDTLEALLIETLGPERNKKVGNGFEDKEFEQIEAKVFLERQQKYGVR